MNSAHTFVATIGLRDLTNPEPPTHTLKLGNGKILVLAPSRKKAIPKDLKGGHFIVSIYNQVDYESHMNSSGPTPVPLEDRELSTDDVAAAFTVATGIANRLSREMFSSSGLYRIGLNGPNAGTRAYFHVHAIVLFHTKEQFKETGFTWTQLVASDTHFHGC